MSELHKLLGVKPLFTTPYHPQGNGRVERLHSTLKSVLRKLCCDQPKEWHRYLAPTLFAIREIPSDRTGFSAFELLYGKQVRGPLAVLRDLWENDKLQPEERPSFQYLFDLRERLEECSEIAARNAEVSATKFKTYFDIKSQNRSFVPGDEILILLPDNSNKLLMSWSGPYKVLERRNKVDYLIDQNGTSKLFHINLLKKYHRRTSDVVSFVCDESSRTYDQATFPVHSCVVDIEEDRTEDIIFPNDKENCKPAFFEELSSKQTLALEQLMLRFKDVLSEEPGLTSTVHHEIKLVTSSPSRAKVYPVSVNLKAYFEEEVENLLRLGVVQQSSSPYSSPVVLVKKPDSSYRLTIDYRHLNSLTIFDAEPPCFIEEELHKFTGSVYYSEIDLTKAYYQIPMSEESKSLTAFPTHLGLMEFTRMPFGLVTAPASYIRRMRVVLAGLSSVVFYFDNVYVYSETFESHLLSLELVFKRLKLHGLTARPSKCRFGFPTMKYLGYIVSNSHLAPQNDKIEALLNLAPPSSKKSLRSFFGMASFYQKFIPKFADLTSPLSDMLKKGTSEPLTWNDDQLKSFNAIRAMLASKPILRLPDLAKAFVVRSDASGVGLGSVLCQYHDGVPFPVSYASRKLLKSEKNYSTIERECLGIIFAINKFNFYLRGREFILEVDHKPLIFLNKMKCSNSRLMRWALSLQPYRYRAVHIAGADNFGADLLSRS